MITAERLQEVLNYDEDTGIFTWKIKTCRKVKIGAVAGSPNGRGYTYIKVDKRRYLAHRLAWLYVNGTWPVAEIDHINGITDDNRISNLRKATHSENLMNRGAQSNNTSGYKGVSRNARLGKWRARIYINGKETHIGSFDCPRKAYRAYSEAAKKHHGKFAKA